MKWLRVLFCTMTLNAGAEIQAQMPVPDRPCSVPVLDTLIYGAGQYYRDCDVDQAAKQKKTPSPSFSFNQDPVCVIAELEFGVDENGRPVDSTARVLSTNSKKFSEASLRGLRYWQYAPAMKGGIAVRQVVRARVAKQSDKLIFTRTEEPAILRPAREPCK